MEFSRLSGTRLLDKSETGKHGGQKNEVIRNNKTNKVSRVADEVAHTAVHAGDAQYVSKSVWKTETRDAAKK